ncbi:DUF2589 domain-containing protein [Leptolyngbyaceae cyanobacterium UHCC 1019]
MSDQQGKELSALDFGSMIGGPLTAIVKAQAQAALASATFIKQVGFHHKKDGNGNDTEEITEAINVEFKYKKPIPGGGTQEATLSVPILTILPIPFLRVEEAEIEFNAKLLSVTHNELLSNSQVGTSTSAKTGGVFSWYGSAQLTANYSSQSVQRSGAETKDSYGLYVHVKASQAEMPAGMDKMLSILEALIEEKVIPIPPATPPSLPATPTISSAVYANNIVTVTGTGFGASVGSSSVHILNSSGQPVSVQGTSTWNDTKVVTDTFTSPLPAGNYTVSVSVNTVQSQTYSFTV